MEDISADVVQETGVVRDNDGGGASVDKVVSDPFNVDNVQVVSGLIEEENVGLEQDSTGKGDLHLPTTGETGDGRVLTGIVEADLVEGLDGLLTGHAEVLIGKDELENSDLTLGSIEIVLDVPGADLFGEGKPSTWPLVMARMRVDFPEPLRPQRPYLWPRLRRRVAVLSKILAP